MPTRAPSQGRRKVVIRRRDYAHLEGKPIGVREAAQKYDVPAPTLSRWATRGIIRELGSGAGKRLLNEADVAVAVAVYRARGGGKGIWVFNRDGTPHVAAGAEEEVVVEE